MPAIVKCTVCEAEFTNHARMRVHRALKHEKDDGQAPEAGGVQSPARGRKAKDGPADKGRARGAAGASAAEPEEPDDDDEADDEAGDDDEEYPWE
jgi:hypothetical protein